MAATIGAEREIQAAIHASAHATKNASTRARDNCGRTGSLGWSQIVWTLLLIATSLHPARPFFKPEPRHLVAGDRQYVTERSPLFRHPLARGFDASALCSIHAACSR